MRFPAQPNQSLIDGLAVLTALTGADEPVGSRELARRLGLEPTRVNRLLKTLGGLGLAEQDAALRYRPGPGVHVLAAQALHGSGLLRRALPALEALHQHGMVVALGVLWRDQVCYLYHADPGMSAGEALGRIVLRPATLTAVGTMLLAAQPESAVRSLYAGREIPNYASAKSLTTTLAQARRDGYVRVVINDGAPASPARRVPERASVAVLVGEARYAAIALSGPIAPADAPRLAAALASAALLIDAASPSVPPAKNPKP